MNCIVAVDQDWGIGYHGDLLARVRADLRNFSAITTGKVVVLGSNTLATFPGGRILKNRTNIVLNWDPDYAPEGAVVVHSLEELFETLKHYPTEEVFVIGGASVYRQLLPYCDKAYVTKFARSFQKDVWFPNLDDSEEWELVWQGEEQQADPETDVVQTASGRGKEPPLSFSFTEYHRIQQKT